MFANDCLTDLKGRQTAHKLSSNKNQKSLRMSRMLITKQAVAILSLISGNAH